MTSEPEAALDFAPLLSVKKILMTRVWWAATMLISENCFFCSVSECEKSVTFWLVLSLNERIGSKIVSSKKTFSKDVIVKV